MATDGVKALYDRALQEFKNDQVDLAISLLEQAVAADGSFHDAYEALALLYFRQKKLDEAIRIIRKLVTLEPENIMAHTNLSRFLAAKGLLEEAEAEQAEARRLTWKAELKAKNQDPAQTAVQEAQKLAARIETYKKVIEMDPKDVLGYFSLGTAYMDGKRYGDAREVFEKAVAVNAEHSPSWLGLGQALEALGRGDEAKEIYKKGIPVAERHGDIIPMKKMETRLGRLESEK